MDRYVQDKAWLCCLLVYSVFDIIEGMLRFVVSRLLVSRCSRDLIGDSKRLPIGDLPVSVDLRLLIFFLPDPRMPFDWR